ncbi:hypothetical protein [Cognatiyoonia sp. IB215182]|uniref:hypothetical protein n=1 Tax=Cognatiyoonia sp. IB215182 TaxID=3097353 RepID=UPI002A0EC2A8|nr:hypothetical protein [Cognatiyoonia sp. IB215182]MDX8355547.1 hypothetical protein [Cognatiyoonia sp. IB215182]
MTAIIRIQCLIVLLAATVQSAMPVYAQGSERYEAEVDATIKSLPHVWETEIADAVAGTWSDDALACIRDVEIIVDPSEDPLVVLYERDRIVLSRGYVELIGQATLFTFLTLLGAVPTEDLPQVLQQHETTLEARRHAYRMHRRDGVPPPPVFLDYTYAAPYQERLGEVVARTGVAQIAHAADMLNGAVLIFALLHEAGHHAYRSCPETVPLTTDLHEEVWADQFALRPFQNEAFPELLAIDAIRVLHAYRAGAIQAPEGSLECRLGRIVSNMKKPDPGVFTLDGLDAPDAPVFATNLARLVPLYRERYTPPAC